MEKINVVSYCTWTSIGSILQAMGLKKALEKNGGKSQILVNNNDKFFYKTRIHSIKSFIVRMHQILINRQRKTAYQKRNQFIDGNLEVDYYSDISDLRKMTSAESDVNYLAGSDQIWNPHQCNPVFFLDFVKDQNRLSYAASMGDTNIRFENLEKFKNYINKFDYISVREQECADVISQLTEKEVNVHIDPTFLVDAEEWRAFEVEYAVNKPYILLYMIYWDESCKTKIKELKKRTGIPVYAIVNSLSRVYADKKFYDVGIGEFLWLMDNAQFVITSSFHGVAFATIFNKKFSAVINPETPSRIDNLLRILQIPKVDITQLDTVDDFDYQKINNLIAYERSRSMEYLKRIMK